MSTHYGFKEQINVLSNSGYFTLAMNVIGVWQQAEPGVKRKIFPIGKSIMMMEVHFEKDAEGYAHSHPHSHPHEQLTYCMKGNIEFIINDIKYMVSAGETIYIPSHAIHSAKALED